MYTVIETTYLGIFVLISFIETSSERREDMLSPRAKAFSVEQLILQHDQEELVKKYILQTDMLTSPSNVLPVPRDDARREEVRVELCHDNLWGSFYRLGTEMIITKSGRRMFPPMRVRVLGTEPGARYTISLDFVCVDHHKYRYVYHSSKWIVSGSGEPVADGHRYGHPDCPFSGHCLVNQIVSFEKIKLTNAPCPKPGQMSLVSMQRFLPRIHVQKLGKDNSVVAHTVVSFPQTAFMAVTAYQNQEITRLKIARNPFAKGFRDTGKNRSPMDAIVTSLQSFLRQKETGSRKRTSKEIAEDNIESTKSLKRISGIQTKVRLAEIYHSCNGCTLTQVPPIAETLPSSQRPKTMLSSSTPERNNIPYTTITPETAERYHVPYSTKSVTSGTVDDTDSLNKATIPSCWCWCLNRADCCGHFSNTFSQSAYLNPVDNVCCPRTCLPWLFPCCQQTLPIHSHCSSHTPLHSFEADFNM